MKAWEVRDRVLGLREVEPGIPGADEVSIRVSHVGICGSDLPKLSDPWRFDLPGNWRPGHEIVGVDPTGATVAIDPLRPCRMCGRCRSGSTHLCAALQRLGWDLPGGFAEEVVVPAANVHLIPDHLDSLHAVLADPAAVAVHGLRCHPVGSPGKLAVIGAGTVGLLTALYAHEQGWDVTVVHRDGRSPNPIVTQIIPAVFRASSVMANQFAVVVDAASGNDPTPLLLALQLVEDGGTIIVQNAYHPGIQLPTQLRDLFRRSIRLIGSFSYCHGQHSDFAVALSLLGAHGAEIAPLVAEAGELADLRGVLNSRLPRTGRQALTVDDR